MSDVNDNAPVFTKPGGYVFSVDEAEVGLSVGTVKVRLFLYCLVFISG